MSLKNILVVGGGSIGNRYLDICKNSKAVERALLVGQRTFSSSLKNKRQGEKEAYIQELAGGTPDIAIVAGPASEHIETAMTFIAMGIHTMIEKPLSNNTMGVDALIKQIDDQSTCVSIGYNLRFLRSLQLFKESIDSGCIGQIYSIRVEVGQYLPDWRPDTDYRKSVSSSYSLGGGVLLELSHEIDYLHWIFGAVKAVSGHIFKSSELEIDVEDSAQFTLFFANELMNTDLTASVSMDFIRRDPIRQCTAIGQSGTLRWDGIEDHLSIYDIEQKKWRILYAGGRSIQSSYEKNLQCFIECIDNDCQPVISVSDGHSTLAVIEAIRDSSNKSGLITLTGQ